MKTVVINGYDLTIEDVVSVARLGAKVELSEDVKEKMQKSRDL